MLSEYQTAILEEMGIATFVESATTVKKECVKNAAPTSKIQSLRDSLGTKTSDSNINQIQQNSSLVVNDKVTATAKKVRVLINKPDALIVKDIAASFETTAISLPESSQWTVNQEQPAHFSIDSVQVPNQPNQLSAKQKRSLWTSIVSVLNTCD